jgi:hypothetical protein
LLSKTISLENSKNRLLGKEQKIEEQKQNLHFLKNSYYELKKQAGKCGLNPT